MSSVGTFGTFTAAQLGIYASQKGLSITGNNIANINTEGYTRQVLQQVSLKTGAADRYANKYDVHVGQGVLCMGVSQIRDPYLDIRYRTEMSKVGYSDAVLGTYNDIAAVLDEVGDGEDGYGVISSGFDEFVNALAGLNVGAGEKVNDTLVKAAAEKLTNYFHKYADELQTLKKNKENDLRQNVDNVNKLLNGIRDLNEAIRKSEIHGDNALEMRDDRNLMIDELSKYLKIDVVYSMEDIGAGLEVEKLTIKLGDANPDDLEKKDEVRLVDGIYAAQMVTPKANPDYGSKDPNKVDIAGFKYLDENGDGTNDPLEAKQEFDANYNMGLTKLLDSKGREWKETKVQPQTIKFSDVIEPECKDRDELEAALNAASVDKPVVIKNADGVRVVIVGKVGEPAKIDGDSLGGKFITTTYSEEIDKFDDNDLYGELQANREMLTEDGEFATKNTIEGVDENAAIKRGIPYYQKSLDLLAKQFAKTYNEANKGYLVDENGNYLKQKQQMDMTTNPPTPVVDGDGKPVYEVDKNGNPVYETLPEVTYYKSKADDSITTTKPADLDQYEIFTFTPNSNMNPDELQALGLKTDASKEDIEAYLKGQGIEKVGGNLFSIRGDLDDDVDSATGEGITASNIDIAYGWSTGDTKIVTTFIKPFDDTLAVSTEGSNVLHMMALLEKDQVYNPKDWYPKVADPNNPGEWIDPDPTNPDIARSEYLFKGSFTEMINNMSTVLGRDQSKTNANLNTSYNAAVELDSSRLGTSGVDLNDEAMNLMQYSKSLNAAYRLMTTIDEALERLINNTGIVGR